MDSTRDVVDQQQNGAWSYFGYDGLGSVRHLTDEYGSITARMRYDPYGVPLDTLPSSLGFTGELTDRPDRDGAARQNNRAASP